MFLYFKENRLCVGVRRRDWSKVWYEPIGTPDNDGTAPIGLFSSSSGMCTREPMEGEVSWIPYFEPKTFESDLKRERQRMQMQFLYDTYRYMIERDEDELEKLAEELHQPNYTRWNDWFCTMRAVKRERARRRERRMQTLTAAGIEPEDALFDSDASDLEGDRDRPPAERAAAVNTNNNGRKRAAGGPNRPRNPNRPHVGWPNGGDAEGSSTPRQGEHDSGYGADGSNSREDESDLDDLELYDSRPPQSPDREMTEPIEDGGPNGNCYGTGNGIGMNQPFEHE